MLQPFPQDLHTQRLHLRGPTHQDASAIFQAYTQDPQVCRFLVWTPHTTLAQTEAFMDTCVHAWTTGQRLPYVMTERESDEAIGMVEARPQGSAVELGYVLGRAHWGKGFMPEAIAALTAALLDNPRFFRVYATCDFENLSSQRTLEKSGFQCEGRLERYAVHPNMSSQPRACFVYAKCR